MSEEEFWRSTLYKINRLLDFYVKDHSMSQDDHSQVTHQETSSKWGRPVIISTDF